MWSVSLAATARSSWVERLPSGFLPRASSRARRRSNPMDRRARLDMCRPAMTGTSPTASTPRAHPQRGCTMARPVDQVTERRTTGDDRSLGELFSDLSRETTTLVRQEVALAKAELSQKAAQAGKDVGFLAAGGAVAYAGFLALVAALIVGLGQAGLSWWVSALLVGIVVAAIGGAFVWTGIQQLRNLNPTPTQTIESLKENQAWTKD